MKSFQEHAKDFTEVFNAIQFPDAPKNLYEPAEYFLGIGGKRVRPVLCLMANELFDEVTQNAFYSAIAIELFHNFTLIHDDMMDAAPLRRGMQTVHEKYNSNIALLSGDVVLIKSYEFLNKISGDQIHKVLANFNKTAIEVCEGQQYDMDYEKQDGVAMDDYIHMITLKTSVLIACSLQLGAMLGGASQGNCDHMYEFGKNLGIAFQIQDDYLDAFGDPNKFGKEAGGDIRQNKKTFLLLHALSVCNAAQRKELDALLANNDDDKVEKVLQIFKDCGVDEWAKQLKRQYFEKALYHLEEIAVIGSRKKPLRDLAEFLISRDY